MNQHNRNLLFIAKLCQVSDKVGLSIDKVLRMAKTVTTIQVRLPLNGQILSRTMVMKRHKPIEKLFDDNFWGTQ